MQDGGVAMAGTDVGVHVGLPLRHGGGDMLVDAAATAGMHPRLRWQGWVHGRGCGCDGGSMAWGLGHGSQGSYFRRVP